MKEDSKKTLNKNMRSAVLRFCGDSGDGMQLSGSQFSNTAGVLGNDLMTLPDFPAEIRAPLGSLSGVSGFQVHFSQEKIYTPGDEIDVLIAMNPAALKTNLKDLRRGGILIVNKDSFNERNLKKSNYSSNPLEEDIIKEKYSCFIAPITQLTLESLKDLKGLSRVEAERCKNFFALGMSYWLFGRDLKYSVDWIEKKFEKTPQICQANKKALQAGYNFSENSELFSGQYEVGPAKLPTGTYRNINGAKAMVFGLLTAMEKSKLPAFYAGYPITPASEILHEISMHRNFNIKSFQAEDEIAAVSAAIGAAYGGNIAVTASSGPGIMLKGEAINLAVMTELPLVILDAQRAGPSTGLPTKMEQSDLFLTLFGRSGESPVIVLAPSSPGDCFFMMIEAVRLALCFMTPVYLLSDLYLILGSEPWRLPNIKEIRPISNQLLLKNTMREGFQFYERDSDNLSRRWVLPGTPKFENCIGGLEKDALTGNVSYDPENHEKMTNLRNQKIQRAARLIPKQEVFGPSSAKLLVIGWGSTYGAIHTAILATQSKGYSVAHIQLRYIKPLAKNLKELVHNYEQILVVEINLGQLALYLKAELGIQVKQLNKVKGQPFLVSEIETAILGLLQA